MKVTIMLYCGYCKQNTEHKVDSAFDNHAVLCLTCYASGPPARSRDKAISNHKSLATSPDARQKTGE
jgi:hypothetical protein